MENTILKDIIALLRLYNNRHDDVALFRILSGKIFSIKRKELIAFTKKISFSNRNQYSKKHYYLINGFDNVHDLQIDAQLFLFIKNKIDIILSQTNMIDLIEVIFNEFLLIRQSKILGCEEDILIFKQKLLLFIKETELVTITDIINFIEREKFEIKDENNVLKLILNDIDYLILKNELRNDKQMCEKFLKRKEKIINQSNDLDVAYYVEQIKNNKYENEKELEKIPTFSASQFNSYDFCPNQYRFCYIYSVPVAQKYYFVFGKVMHSVLEEITKRIKENREVSEDFAKLMYNSLWDNNGYDSKEQEEEYKQKGFEIISAFLKKQNETDTDIIEIEKKFNIEIDKFKIIGFIDRIDVDENNDYIVIDYKTSKSEKDNNSLRHDIQLLLYYDAVHKLFGKPPKMVGHWYLLSNNIVSVVPSIKDLENIRSKILHICTSILTEKFEPKKSSGCNFCDFKLLCNIW
jgi:putative RecB family exonuclease